jgi:hypothetical protein
MKILFAFLQAISSLQYVEYYCSSKAKVRTPSLKSISVTYTKAYLRINSIQLYEKNVLELQYVCCICTYLAAKVYKLHCGLHTWQKRKLSENPLYCRKSKITKECYLKKHAVMNIIQIHLRCSSCALTMQYLLVPTTKMAWFCVVN